MIYYFNFLQQQKVYCTSSKKHPGPYLKILAKRRVPYWKESGKLRETLSYVLLLLVIKHTIVSLYRQNQFTHRCVSYM